MKATVTNNQQAHLPAVYVAAKHTSPVGQHHKPAYQQEYVQWNLVRTGVMYFDCSTFFYVQNGVINNKYNKICC